MVLDVQIQCSFDALCSIFLSWEFFHAWLPQDEDVAAERRKVKQMMAEALDKVAEETVREFANKEGIGSKEVVVLQGLTKVWSLFL